MKEMPMCLSGYAVRQLLSILCAVGFTALTVYGQQTLSTTRLGPVDVATVSPDGRYIAAMILNASQRTDGKWTYAESLQMYDPVSAKVISKTEFPSAALVEDASLFGYAYIDYCNRGSKLVAFDKIRTLYILSPSSFQVQSKVDIGDMRPRGQSEDIQVTMACAASSPLIAVSVYGGRFGWGLVRVFDLTSGAMVAEFNQAAASGSEVGTVSLSPDGSKLAILLRNPGRTVMKDPNVQVRDTMHMTLLNQFSTGDASSRLLFSGNLEIATIEGEAGGRVTSRRALRLWDIESGREIIRCSDPSRDVQSPISSSADGRRILGYIPIYRDCRFCNGLEGRHDVKEQRFAVWNKDTGMEIYRSDPFGPILDPIGPQLVLSQEGGSAMVYWPHEVNTPRLFILP